MKQRFLLFIFVIFMLALVSCGGTNNKNTETSVSPALAEQTGQISSSAPSPDVPAVTSIPTPSPTPHLDQDPGPTTSSPPETGENTNGPPFIDTKIITEKITALYEGILVDIKKGTDEYHESFYVIISLSYKYPLPETEFLRQVNGVLSVAEEYINDNTIVSVVLDWPGEPTPDIHHSYSNITIIHTAYSSLENIMQDGRTYLSADEARELLYEWLPPVINSDDKIPRYEENISIELINTSISGSDAYYLFDISNKDYLIFALRVNAINGSISDWFDDIEYAEVGHASAEQIEAVMDFLAEEGIEMTDHVNWRAYMINEDYMFLISSEGDSMGPFRLYEEGGRIKAEWYHNYSYDY